MKTPLYRLLLILLLSLALHLVLLLVPLGDAVHIGSDNNELRIHLLPPSSTAPSEADASPEPSAQDSPESAPQADHAAGKNVSTRSTLAMPDTRSNYYPSQLLNEKPRILHDPLYDMARQMPTEATGTVVLRLHINEEGAMDEVIVEKSDVKTDFLPQLQRAAMGMQFTPGRLDGRTVKTEMRIELEIDRLRQWP